ncbi:MAG: MBL fold metallo-hydrolase [Anaerolineae bacterium]|nr:MBL fold metallo-hydrolase [Anaerolineae bacterium]
MLLRYFYDKRLAQASYMIGCPDCGEALIIDPIRNIEPYLKAAKEEGLRIAHITETHIHADFVSGVPELAAATGAQVYLSDMGDADWKYAYAGALKARLLHDGDNWMVGKVRVEVIHTPGHTPEHLCFMITDTAGANKPMGIFTGDFLFVGDVGRPDLLEEAAGIANTKELGARQQYHSVQRFKDYPDYLQIWPGHGAGSACGKALGAIPSTTLGYEKMFNPAFQQPTEDQFAIWLLTDQPEAPRYFAQMKKVNKEGAALIKTLREPQPLNQLALDKVLEAGDLVVDVRRLNAFARAHVAGAISIPASSNSFSTYVGWFVDYQRPLYLILEPDALIQPLLEALYDIGVDNVGGYFSSELIGKDAQTLRTISVEQFAELAAKPDTLLLDVRGSGEFAEVHLPNARHIFYGTLPRYLDQLPRTGTIVTYCASGVRSQIAASVLQKHGFDNVVNLKATTEQWSALLPSLAQA